MSVVVHVIYALASPKQARWMDNWSILGDYIMAVVLSFVHDGNIEYVTCMGVYCFCGHSYRAQS